MMWACLGLIFGRELTVQEDLGLLLGDFGAVWEPPGGFGRLHDHGEEMGQTDGSWLSPCLITFCRKFDRFDPWQMILTGYHAVPKHRW